MRTPSVLVGLVLALLLVGLASARPGGQIGHDELPPVRLEKIPAIKLPPTPPPDAAESAYIKDLIRRLAEIDRPDFGFAPLMSGTAFAPLPGTESPGAFVIAPQGLQHSSPFVELVRLGPRALPFLIGAVDDPAPTKLTIKLGGILDTMDFANEMGFSPANGRERKIVLAKPDRWRERRMDGVRPQESHTVTIGDICFVIIGQITGREYSAVRYQPSGGVVINSPTQDASIAKAVRAIWSSDNPAQFLLDTLLLDYTVRPLHKGGKDEFDDYWYDGTRTQPGAAMRLLFYFPKQTAAMVSRRLNRLDIRGSLPPVEAPENDPRAIRWEKRELANEVRTDEFIKAVSWCREAQIRASMKRIFRHASDFKILMASYPGVDWLLVRRRLAPLLLHPHREMAGWNPFEILVALRQSGGDKAKPLYREFLKQGDVGRRYVVCRAVERTNGEWDQEFLWPMLMDKSEGYSRHPIKPGARQPLVVTRMCDVAAQTISRHRKDVTFNLIGTTAELDQQIAVMRKQLKASGAATNR